MKANRICIILVMLFSANIIFGQRKETISVSFDEIKDMPHKIITAYFKPVYSSTGVYYPLMQWYAFENKVDTWDKNALTKFNASIYSFKDEPIKAAKFALQYCRSFGESVFTANFKAIGFNSAEINCILRCYREEKKWQELDINQLAELSQRIFDSSNRSFVNKVKVLQDSNCADFADYTGKKSYLLFGIIATYHKLVYHL